MIHPEPLRLTRTVPILWLRAGMEKRQISEREYCHEALGESFARALSEYDTRRRVQTLIEEFLTDVMVRNKKAIDVGCGLGFFSQRLQERGLTLSLATLDRRCWSSEKGLHLFPFQLGMHEFSTWCDHHLQVARRLMINICILGRKDSPLEDAHAPR